jgi:hypothetical protein
MVGAVAQSNAASCRIAELKVARPALGARVASILPFIPRNVFDDTTTRIMSRAFDAACKELHDTGQPELVHEVIAKRIITAAQKGERNVVRLRDIALAGLRDATKRM